MVSPDGLKPCNPSQSPSQAPTCGCLLTPLVGVSTSTNADVPGGFGDVSLRQISVAENDAIRATLKRTDGAAEAPASEFGLRLLIASLDSSAQARPRAEEIQTRPNELLEMQHGNHLDTRAAGTAGGADPHLVPVGALDRAEVIGR